MSEKINAEVLAVYPHKIIVSVSDLKNFAIVEEKLAVGSYLKICDDTKCGILSVIENFRIEQDDKQEDGRKHILETVPLGFVDEECHFTRGGNRIAIPPTGAKVATKEEIRCVYEGLEREKRFCFSNLSQNPTIEVPVDGDKFFNKHVAIVGSTGSGKSHTVAKVLQEAVASKDQGYTGLNNSHIVIFDIHSEYRTAFPDAQIIDIDNMKLPYWLMNSEELEELFLESGDFNNYNQSSLLNSIVTLNKQVHLTEPERAGDIEFDTPVYFSIKEVVNCLQNLSHETRKAKNSDEITIQDDRRIFTSTEEKYKHYFSQVHQFEEQKNSYVSKGTYNDGTIDKFISRLKTKVRDPRLKFLFNTTSDDSFENIVRQFLGYNKEKSSNVILVDLSGVPFEVLSITVSLISRMLFDYCFYFKKVMPESETKTPVVVVYEEAHKYVPKTDASKYKAARYAIEKIAKEGRKYGISSVIVSQRPSEISETIFSQCSNFIAMRLTNPVDQNYVKKLLPDTLGSLTEILPVLQAGEALLIGDAVTMPSIVLIARCAENKPSSMDIPYLQEWKKEWYSVKFEEIVKVWTKK